MINTVPATTTLTEPIVPNRVKPINVSLSIDDDGSVTFSGYIRVGINLFFSTSLLTACFVAVVNYILLQSDGSVCPAFVSTPMNTLISP